MRFVYIVALIIFAQLAFGCGQGMRLKAPVHLRAGSTPAGTESAILAAITEKRWQVEHVQPGRIVARRTAGEQVMRVEFRYDAARVQLDYLDSKNLRASRHANGYTYITKKGNGWFVKLSEEVAQNLPLASGVHAQTVTRPY